MPSVRVNLPSFGDYGVDVLPASGRSHFVDELAALHPWLWYQFNDNPASGVALDYGNTAGPIVPPIGPPHSAVWPVGLSSGPGATHDGRTAALWTGAAKRFAYSGGISSGTNYPYALSLLCWYKWAGDGEAFFLWNVGAGNAVQSNGPATLFASPQADNSGITMGTFYNGGGNGVHKVAVPSADGNWHLLGVNYTNPGIGPGLNIPMEAFWDGVLVDSFVVNPVGTSYFDLVPNSMAVGGNVWDDSFDNSGTLSVQDFAIFADTYAQFGGALTAGQYAALFAAR